MKKTLLLTLITLLLALAIFTVLNGVDLGEEKILSFMQIQDKNAELEQRVDEATKVASVDYQRKINEMESNIKNLEDQKATYEDMVSVSTEEQIKQATQFGNYSIEFLWAEIDTHRKKKRCRSNYDNYCWKWWRKHLQS